MKMFGKPKFGDTDEEILRQQEEYFKKKSENKIQLSTKYVRSTGDQQNRNPIDNNVSSTTDNDKSDRDKNVLPDKLMVGKIVERKNDYDINIDDTVKFKTGFPQATRRKDVKTTSTRSIFAQQSRYNRTQPTNQPQPMEVDPQPSGSINEFVSTEKLQAKLKNLPPKSYILKGTEKDVIHQENIDKLEMMTEEEIIKEQKSLLNALDPEIVKFFKSKRNAMDTVQEKEEDKIDSKEELVEVDEIETPREILEKSDRWLNFKTVETEKLQWMRDITIPKKNDGETYEARFDFEGWLLPFVETEITEKKRVLYHHGTESGRPGYSLQELFKLCRSNVQQQRILSLNTISNILAINSTGVYENVIDIPIEQIFFIIRIALDDNTPAVLNAALKAMHHIFYNQIDEVCIDSLLGFGCGEVQPILTVAKSRRTKEDIEEEKEINDQKMAEMDLVKCLMRTDILIRIRYIINTIRPNVETITYCLELLVRIVRDSTDAFNQVVECEDLLGSIARNFLPKIHQSKIGTSAYDTPQLPAIKLMRIVASRNKVIANIVAEKYGVLDSISSYIANDIGSNIVGVRIQTESLNLLAIYLRYRLKIEYYTEVLLFLLRNFEYHFNNTNINEKISYVKQSHFSAVINVIKHTAIINHKYIETFIPILRNCCVKYFRQFSTLNDFKCGGLQIISSLFSSLTKNAESFSTEISSLLKSNGFDNVTKNIKNASNLLSGYDPLKSSANLQFAEAVVWKTSEHVVPVLLTSSSIPFLRALSFTIVESTKQVKFSFVQHPNILKYLRSLKTSSKFNLTTNWFTKIETQLLMNIFKCVTDVSDLLPEPMFFYESVVKCIGLFGIELKADVDYILKNIVFNRSFYPNELLLKGLSIGTTEHEVINSLRYLDEIYDCYARFMGLKITENRIESLCIDIRIGNIVPIDWMYSPIIVMYSQGDQRESNEKGRLLTRCLQWIFLYETYFPVLSSLINTTDRFCRLCCVFLASNCLFLEDDVKKLLKNILDLLLMPDNYKQLNFDQEIQGLNNFQDFYTELLEHYQGVSYGDKLFANFVLIPLAQRHNVKWRKVLWSEYEGVTQIISLTEEECVLNMNEFIEPLETDLSVLDCYRRSLTSGHLNRSPLLKKIAVFHMENHFKNKRVKT